MTDLDNTQIISADESLLQNTSTIDTVGFSTSQTISFESFS